MKRSHGKASGDFAKKKRKVGKGKRVAENATEVSFKSRAVVVPSQLTGTADPTSNRKLSLQALLQQQAHFKSAVRRDALIGLRDLLQENPALLPPNLASLIHHLSPIVDIEGSVRHALLLFLRFLLGNVSEKQLSPFFPVLVAHLRCGLTHIDDRIQRDSLKVFDLVLSHFPRLLVSFAQELLSLIIRLLSRQDSVQASGKNATRLKSDANRAALSSNPSSMLSRQSSRFSILDQLMHYFQAILVHMKEQARCAEPGPHTQGQRFALTVDVKQARVVEEASGDLRAVYDASCSFAQSVPQVAVVRQFGLRTPRTAFLSQTSPSAQRGRSLPKYAFPERESLVDVVQTLLPLLLECWVECSPSHLLSVELAGSMKTNTVLIMDVVLRILLLLLKVAACRDELESDAHVLETVESQSLLRSFSELHSANILKHIVVYFPFLDARLMNTQFNIFMMNFTVCEIVLHLLYPHCSSSSPGPNPDLLKGFLSVCDFFCKLEQCTKAIVSSSQFLLPSVESIAESLPLLVACIESSRATEWRGLPPSTATLRDIFRALLGMYDACHPQSAAKHVLVKCFSQLERSKEDYSASDQLHTELLLPWQCTLPSLLVELGRLFPDLSSLVVASLSPETEALRSSLGSIFDPDGVLPQLPLLTQRKVVELVWPLLPRMEAEDVGLLSRCVCSGRCEQGCMVYLVQIVHQRLVLGTNSTATNPAAMATVPNYLNFMLAVAIGRSKKQLMLLNKQPPSSANQDRDILIQLCSAELDEGGVKYRETVLEAVSQCLRSSPFSSVILDLLKGQLSQLLVKSSRLTHDTALGILRVVACLVPESGMPSSLQQPVALLCISCLVSMENAHLDSCDITLATACFKWITQLLRASQSLTRVVLVEFKNVFNNFGGRSSVLKVMISAFVSFLDSPHINSALRKLRREVFALEAFVLDQIPADEVITRHQLELAGAKFRQGE